MDMNNIHFHLYVLVVLLDFQIFGNILIAVSTHLLLIVLFIRYVLYLVLQISYRDLHLVLLYLHLFIVGMVHHRLFSIGQLSMQLCIWSNQSPFMFGINIVYQTDLVYHQHRYVDLYVLHKRHVYLCRLYQLDIFSALPMHVPVIYFIGLLWSIVSSRFHQAFILYLCYMLMHKCATNSITVSVVMNRKFDSTHFVTVFMFQLNLFGFKQLQICINNINHHQDTFIRYSSILFT